MLMVEWVAVVDEDEDDRPAVAASLEKVRTWLEVALRLLSTSTSCLSSGLPAAFKGGSASLRGVLDVPLMLLPELVVFSKVSRKEGTGAAEGTMLPTLEAKKPVNSYTRLKDKMYDNTQKQ
jgi:hypothetical protein